MRLRTTIRLYLSTYYIYAPRQSFSARSGDDDDDDGVGDDDDDDDDGGGGGDDAGRSGLMNMHTSRPMIKIPVGSYPVRPLVDGRESSYWDGYVRAMGFGVVWWWEGERMI